MKAHYAPLTEEVRDMVARLRLDDPEDNSLRKWASRLKKDAGCEVQFRTIKRREDSPATLLDLGYVVACAIAADVEIVLGKNPRVVQAGIQGQANDFVSQLRRAAAQDPSFAPKDVEDLKLSIEGKLPARYKVAV